MPVNKQTRSITSDLLSGQKINSSHSRLDKFQNEKSSIGEMAQALLVFKPPGVLHVRLGVDLGQF